MADAPDLDLLAASLRADATDTAAFLEALAARLEGALPGQVDVERKGRLFGGAKRVRRIAVRLGDTHYDIAAEGGALAARRRSVVRGIALKSETLGVEAWIDAPVARPARPRRAERPRPGGARAAAHRLMPFRRRPSADEARRAEESLARLEAGGIPVAAADRLEAFRTPAGASSRATSASTSSCSPARPGSGR